MGRRWGYFTALIAVICVAFLVDLVFFVRSRTVRADLIQGVLIGYGLAFVTAQVYARFVSSRVNGWVTVLGLGDPGAGWLRRAAYAQLFPGPVNTAVEAVYWWTTSDAEGRRLTGRRAYVLHFAPGGLPPNAAFWSLTMGDAGNRFVANPLHRYSVGDRSGLERNADGSLDVYLQSTAPAGRESNWLPAPAGPFITTGCRPCCPPGGGPPDGGRGVRGPGWRHDPRRARSRRRCRAGPDGSRGR